MSESAYTRECRRNRNVAVVVSVASIVVIYVTVSAGITTGWLWIAPASIWASNALNAHAYMVESQGWDAK